jgi:hypothetical protein
MQEDFFIKAREFLDIDNDDLDDSTETSSLEIQSDSYSEDEDPLVVNDRSDEFDSERFIWKQTETNGASEAWHYVNELSKEYVYIDLIILGGSEAKVGNYWKKLRMVNNVNSNRFIKNIKPTDQARGITKFSNDRGCIISLRSSEGINAIEKDPLIVLNLEDAGQDHALQQELISTLNSVQERIILLYCHWNEGDSLQPISLVEQTNNSMEAS